MLVSFHPPGIELEEELGRGAYSIVFRGRRGSMLCAVKVPRVRARWTRWVYREAVALARVRHPGLPRVLEVGEVDDLPYLVLELVEGETLGDRLGRGPFGENETFELALQLASALAAVHDAGLVHRDVKPRNILLECSGGVRLVDFGFASPVERIYERDETAGTPGYAAPEQLRAPSRVDGRSDLYALGRVLADCLTGRLSLVGESTRHLVDGTTTPLAQIVRGLSASSPDDRYPDARAVLSDLERARAGREICGPRGYAAGQRPAPLVGREPELQQLMRAWASVGVASGSVALVRGQRGSGKSRLLSAFTAKVLQAGCRRVLLARCRDGDAPLASLRRILEAYVASLDRGLPADKIAGERALQRAAGDQLRSFAILISPELAGILGAGGGAEAASGGFAEGAAELFLRLARHDGPLAIFVDDFQWIDPASRDVLVRVAHRIDGGPLLLALTARTEEKDIGVDRILALGTARVSRLELLPFEERQVAALVASYLGIDRADDALVRRIVALSDETPLGALEVLGALLDAGAVRPKLGAWIYEPARADRVALPTGALALLGRRLKELPPATRAVLEMGAIIGATFPDDLLARVVGLDLGDLGYGLADARRAGLIEVEASGHRFVHDSLRETLLASLGSSERRSIHQRVAEALDDAGDTSFETRCAVALHYADGELTRAPMRAYQAARAAANVALERFDNETVLRFLDLARAAAEVGTIPLDASFHRTLGEAQLRLGALDESLSAFEAGLAMSDDARTRATLHGRISWVHSTAAEPERAWASLDRAFAALGARMPLGSPTSAARTLAYLARSEGRKVATRRALLEGVPRLECELLCDLHYQNARLGLEHGKPFRLLQSTVEALSASERLGPCRTQARARAVYGFVLSALGRRIAGQRELESARTMAREHADPITYAFCVQVESMAASWSGDMDRALELLRTSVEIHGPWLELNEYCGDAASGDLIESIRGRSNEAWTWVAVATDRLKRSYPTSSVFGQYIVQRARAALASLGRSVDSDPWLAAQVAAVANRHGPTSGFSRLISWGCRARVFVESGTAGPEFEALVADFRAEGFNPRLVHPTVVEYYVAVAHVRLHQCLRSPRETRDLHIPALKSALHDLRAAARMDLLKAHSTYIEGCVAWLEGALGKAERCFAKAEVVAAEQTCPWVLYGIARVRAHALREQGNPNAARDQARIAEVLAREHGSEPRARWVREEFGLPVPVAPARPSSRSSRSSRAGTTNHARQQLAALLHVIRAPVADLRPEQQVPAVLDDLLRALDAEHGLLWFQPEPRAGPRMILGRARGGEDWSVTEEWRESLLDEVRETGEPWPPPSELSEILSAPSVPPGVDPTRVLAVPLFLHEHVVGAMSLERTAGSAAFTQEERDLLLVLSYQVPISIELARLLAEREQLQASLQQAQKMEAVGQLASSVAHDFANMLTAVRGSVGVIANRVGLDPEVAAELEIISGATDRAGRLMRQLLGFSQHQPVARVPSSINDLILDLAPMLERLVGERVTVALNLDPDTQTVNLERASFDQVLVNLVLNARDAMPAGGTLTIATRNTGPSDPRFGRGTPGQGRAVVVEFTDTGHGIPPENLARVFDPFFTTKPSGAGTGIGLTTAYAFVTSSGGRIDLSSEVGRGTTFRLYFPQAEDGLGQSPEQEGPSVRTSGSYWRDRRFDPGSSTG